jgi:CubicO group peptidase (beta-lactamase class C family)
MPRLRPLLLVILALLPALISAEPAPLAVPAPPAAAPAVTPEQARAAAEAKLAELPAYVDKALADWKVPGLSIGIVQNGQMVYARGFGLRDMERKLPATEHTVYPIGSITKSFTVSLLGMLADEGKFEWDKPVRDYLPDFKLKDDYASAHVRAMTPCGTARR